MGFVEVVHTRRKALKCQHEVPVFVVKVKGQSDEGVVICFRELGFQSFKALGTASL